MSGRSDHEMDNMWHDGAPLQGSGDSIRDRLFDREPRLPIEAMGLPVLDILQIAYQITTLARKFNLSPSLGATLDRTKAVFALYPLLKQAITTPLTPQDIREYRKAIKKIHLNAGCADSLIQLTILFPPLFVYLRMAFNQSLEKQVANSQDVLIKQVARKLRDHLPLIEAISEYENPEDQLESEWQAAIDLLEKHLLEVRGFRWRKETGEEWSLSEKAELAVHKTLNMIEDSKDAFPLIKLIAGHFNISISEIGHQKHLRVLLPELLESLNVLNARYKPSEHRDYYDELRATSPQLERKYLGRKAIEEVKTRLSIIVDTLTNLLITRLSDFLEQYREDASEFITRKKTML